MYLYIVSLTISNGSCNTFTRNGHLEVLEPVLFTDSKKRSVSEARDSLLTELRSPVWSCNAAFSSSRTPRTCSLVVNRL